MNTLRPAAPAAALLALALVATSKVGAATAPAPANTETRKLEEIFNTDLPKTETKGSVRLIVHPHFGDFLHRSYIRIPTGVCWGAGERVELSATAEPYLAHGRKSRGTGNGIGDFELGGKYQWPHWPSSDFDTSIGANVFTPVGHPPRDMTTGYQRHSPYFVIAHDVSTRAGLKVFLNTGVNLLRKTSVAGSFKRNQPRSDSIALTPGLVYDHYPYHATFELGVETTSLIGRGNQSFVTVRPGFAWDLPKTLKFNSSGRWLIGVGLHVTVGPDGVTSGAGGKVRGEFGISRSFGK